MTSHVGVWPVAANRSRRRACVRATKTSPRTSYNMKGKQKPTAEQEPIGIVISRGPRNEKAPTFFAYMWAPDPEGDDKGSEPHTKVA